MRFIDQQLITGALANAERVARAIVPDLEGRPLYLLQPHIGTISDPGQFGCQSSVYYRDLDLAFQPMLEAEGRWKGRGIAFIVDALWCYASATDNDYAFRRTLGVVLHELCHWADADDTEVPSETPLEDFRRACSAESHQRFATKYPNVPLGFMGHDAPFTRLICHLWWRSQRRGGHILGTQYLSFGAAYPGLEMLPTPATCIEALGEEFEAFDEMPLRWIAARPQPHAYTNLWQPIYERYLSAIEAAA